MSKYDVLSAYLKAQSSNCLSISFSEIEKVIGFKLPASAHEYPAWWSNENTTHVQARAWMNAGFETEDVDLGGEKLVFKRVSKSSSGPGMSEAPREFVPPQQKIDRHPALGAMKGTFTIEPGYDLAKPVYSDEEWEEIEGEMLAKFDRMFPRGVK